MSLKIDYVWLNGPQPDSTSTAYLDCDVEDCPYAIHTGHDKYTEEPVAVAWDPIDYEWFEIDIPDHRRNKGCWS